jgi:hypothetical protein
LLDLKDKDNEAKQLSSAELRLLPVDASLLEAW